MSDFEYTPEDARKLRIRDAVEQMKGCRSDYLSVVVEGREIPKLRMKERADTESGMISLQVDGRFEIDVPAEYAPSVAWLVAQSLAIGSGYAFLGSETKDRPFAPEARGIPSGMVGSDDK